MMFCRLKSILYCIIAVYFHGRFVAADLATDPSKTLTPLGCVGGNSVPDCPKSWRFSGGPGYVGQRVGSDDTKIMCSPSCAIRDGSVDKQCSLIMVLHGIYSNPQDMVRSIIKLLFLASLNTLHDAMPLINQFLVLSLPL
jgi:hypothetical protein